MSLPRRQLVAWLARRTTGGHLTGHDRTALAAYLLSSSHSGDVLPLVRDLGVARTRSGKLEVTAVSVHPLTPSVRRDIQCLAKQLYPDVHRVVITSQLDPSLVGGVRLRVGEYELDLSVHGQLERLAALALERQA